MLASTIPMDEGASVAFLTAYLQAPTLVGLRLSTVREKIEMWREGEAKGKLSLSVAHRRNLDRLMPQP